MKEFVLNSRHPGPRREKWGWEKRPLRHFGRISGISGRIPRGHFLCAGACKWTHLLGIGRPIFDKSEKIVLFTPRRPKGSPRDTQGTPKGAPRDPQGTPEGPHGVPKGPPRGPLRAQGQPKESQVGPKFKPKDPKAGPRATKTSQEDKLYQQTPDQPPARPLCYHISFYIYIYIYDTSSRPLTRFFVYPIKHLIERHLGGICEACERHLRRI